MSGSEYSKKAVEKLQNASPLALSGVIAECEFYDQTESEKVFADVVAEFEKDGGGTNSILKPVSLAIVDGLLEGTKAGKAMRKKGITASRVLQECDAFTYGEMEIGPIPGVAYVDWKNAADERAVYGGRPDRAFHRTQLQNSGRMTEYKEKADAEAASSGRKNLIDEYSGDRNITAKRSNPDQRRDDPKNSHQAETDHVIPLKELHKRFKGNYGLSMTDIRNIANMDDNFALTSSKVNRSKQDLTNKAYLKKLRKSTNPEDRALADKLEAGMMKKEKAAEKAIVKGVNEAVKNNLLGKGAVSRQEMDAGIKAYEKKTGKKLKDLKPEERAAIKKEVRKGLQSDKAKKIYGKASTDAAKQAADMAAGNAILYILKPIYYELKDSFKNGFIEGVSCATGTDAVRVRFTRVKKYLIENASEFLGDGVGEFIKGFVSAIIESIIGLFLGMFKSVLKLLKEGVRIFVQAAKILWGKDSAKMTSAQKGDAIVKLIGGSVAALAGIGIDALLNSAGIPDTWSVPLSTMLSGIVSAVFMCLLDKADLFNVRDERRNARLKEVFDARVADIRADAANFSSEVNRRLIADRCKYMELDGAVNAALDSRDIHAVDKALSGMADFFKVTLPYEDSQSFVRYWKTHTKITIGGEDAA